MKYMVMECHPAYAVVLCDNGTFLKVANMRYEVGQTVTEVTELSLPSNAEQPAVKQSRRWISAFVAVAACMMLVLTSLFSMDRTPYASVYLTINPEVRIDVNKHDQVIDAEGMNPDGIRLLENYEFRNKDLDLVMDDLVDRAIDMGYLHEGGKITLSLDADDEWVVGHKEHLSTHLNEHLTEKITVVIDIEKIIHDQNGSGGVTLPVSTGIYSESDYGETEDDGESDYELPDSNDSPYDTSEEDGQTDYDDVTEPAGHSDYETESEDGDSSYENNSAHQATSNYDPVSDYDVPEPSDSKESEYDAPVDKDPIEKSSDYASSDDEDEDEKDEDDDDDEEDDDEGEDDEDDDDDDDEEDDDEDDDDDDDDD